MLRGDINNNGLWGGSAYAPLPTTIPIQSLYGAESKNAEKENGVGAHELSRHILPKIRNNQAKTVGKPSISTRKKIENDRD